METVKNIIERDLKKAIEALGTESAGDLLVRPNDLSKGDFACNLCFSLAKQIKKSPQDIASMLVEALKAEFTNSEQSDYDCVAEAGYINFTVANRYKFAWLEQVISGGLKGVLPKFDKKQKILIEFISANPTGPLTLANGRAGFLGDALAKILRIRGHEVNTEYYINDAGNQIELLAESVLAQLGKAEDKEILYKGKYIKELSKKFAQESVGKTRDEFGRFLADYLMENEIKPVILDKMMVGIDRWVSEYNDIRQTGLLDEVLKALEDSGHTFKEEDALYLKTTTFGDDKDRVLIKSDGKYTYFLVDIAYHLEKARRQYDHLITILGADHYGYVVRLGAGLEALGYPHDILEIVLLQLVKLYKNGQEVRMSKRAGNFILMEQALEDVPSDVLRFYLLSYNPNSQVDINLDALSSKTDKNPVYLVQYAFARINSIMKKVQEYGYKQSDISSDIVSDISNYWQLLFRETYFLIEAVIKSGNLRHPHLITNQIMSLSLSFHKFYEQERIIDNERVVNERLELVQAVRRLMQDCLEILGISAPEQMIREN